MAGQQKVDIHVADRKLTIACPKGQESALSAAALELNKRLASANQQMALKSPDQALLMTALNLANDLIQTQQKYNQDTKQMQDKIDLLQTTIKTAVQKSHNVKTERPQKKVSNG